LQKICHKAGYFTGFCEKNSDARQKIPKTGDTLKNIVVAQVTVPHKRAWQNDPGLARIEFSITRLSAPLTICRAYETGHPVRILPE